jgi:hypothetical protein
MTSANSAYSSFLRGSVLVRAIVDVAPRDQLGHEVRAPLHDRRGEKGAPSARDRQLLVVDHLVGDDVRDPGVVGIPLRADEETALRDGAAPVEAADDEVEVGKDGHRVERVAGPAGGGALANDLAGNRRVHGRSEEERGRSHFFGFGEPSERQSSGHLVPQLLR